MVQQDRIELKCSQDLRPANAVDNGRNSFALYTDLEYDV
jgi:hypothetical protein